MKHYVEKEDIDLDEMTLEEVTDELKKLKEKYGKFAILKEVIRYSYNNDSWRVWTIQVRENF